MLMISNVIFLKDLKGFDLKVSKGNNFERSLNVVYIQLVFRCFWYHERFSLPTISVKSFVLRRIHFCLE